MNKYYSSNALYERLQREGCHDFHWAVGNSWVLLYGDSSPVPRLIVFASGASSEELDELGRQRMKATFALAWKLARRAGLPFATIEFDDRSGEISEVSLNKKIVSLDELKAWFSKFDLAVKGNETGAPLKAINDASSSAYHNWQRSALGRITVVDIDLVRIDAITREPMTIYELKRSYIAIDNWSPFRADYRNFDLLAKLAEMANVRFLISYNVRHKKPNIYDDVRIIHLFSYSVHTGAESLAVVSFENFVQEPR